MRLQRAYKACTDRRCITGTPCRQAEPRGYAMICKGLTNPRFENGICPFYKTKEQYAEEYRQTNKQHVDPYR